MSTSQRNSYTNSSAADSSAQPTKARPISTAVEPPSSKPPTTLSPSCIIAEKATLVGSHRITIAADVIIHPFARIDSSRGPVVLKERCLIWERAVVGGGAVAASAGSTRVDGGEGEEEQDTTELAEDVVISSGATVEAGASIGAHTVIDVRAQVGVRAEVGPWCKVGPCCVIEEAEKIGEYMVVVEGDHGRWSRVNVTARDNERVRELHIRGHTNHVEALRKMIKGSVAKWA